MLKSKSCYAFFVVNISNIHLKYTQFYTKNIIAH